MPAGSGAKCRKLGSEWLTFSTIFAEATAQRAFHGLLEMENTVVPALIDGFHNEDDADTREFLVEVIWQHRQVSAIPFLSETLFDEDPAVWKTGLGRPRHTCFPGGTRSFAFRPRVARSLIETVRRISYGGLMRQLSKWKQALEKSVNSDQRSDKAI